MVQPMVCNECSPTRTFAWHAVGRPSVKDGPAEQGTIRDVLFGPVGPQSPASAALLTAHAWHVEHLAATVLSLLEPAVPSWKKKIAGGGEGGRERKQPVALKSEAADPDTTRAVCISRAAYRLSRVARLVRLTSNAIALQKHPPHYIVSDY